MNTNNFIETPQKIKISDWNGNKNQWFLFALFIGVPRRFFCMMIYNDDDGILVWDQRYISTIIVQKINLRYDVSKNKCSWS
jgi:hypothetical protein